MHHRTPTHLDTPGPSLTWSSLPLGRDNIATTPVTALPKLYGWRGVHTVAPARETGSGAAMHKAKATFHFPLGDRIRLDHTGLRRW